MTYEIQPEDVEEIINIISQNPSLRSRLLSVLQDRPAMWQVDESSGHRLFRTFCEEKGVSVRTYNAVARSQHMGSKCTVNDIVADFNRSNISYLDDYFSNFRGVGNEGVGELMRAFDEITLDSRKNAKEKSVEQITPISNGKKQKCCDLKDMSVEEAKEKYNKLLKASEELEERVRNMA